MFASYGIIKFILLIKQDERGLCMILFECFSGEFITYISVRFPKFYYMKAAFYFKVQSCRLNNKYIMASTQINTKNFAFLASLVF